MAHARTGSADNDVAVVIATRDRRTELLSTLGRLVSLPDRPRIIVVDNASRDGSPEAIRSDYPAVKVISLTANLGAAARNVGIERADCEYVAFSDDDSWWTPGALSRAAQLFASYPSLALIAGRILIEPGGRTDPTCATMARSPLRASEPLPGPPVVGFVGCGSVIRRDAFLEVGGFESRLEIGGEEHLLAIDLLCAGWNLAYVDDVVAHHQPSPRRDRGSERRLRARNAVWAAWLRRPPRTALIDTFGALAQGARDPAARRGFADAVAGLPWLLRERRVVPRHVEDALRAVARAQRLDKRTPGDNRAMKPSMRAEEG